MSKKQVRAVYDFSGEPGTAELSILTGQLLTITRENVGEGWWEGMNQAGETGLFPADYVEEVVSSRDPPAMRPPPLPEAFASSWDESTEPAGATPQEGADFWEDDDWDDDQEGGGTQAGAETQSISSFPDRQFQARSASMDHADESVGGKGDSKGTVGRKNFNRFSGFGKSGLESFILTPGRPEVTDSEKVSIVMTEGGVVWNPITDIYECYVASPKKESKLKGLKSFIAYQITPTFNHIQVSRRYKHFDWLHERLEEKFSLIPIPPLPDKQISGRYENQFIEHRRVQLQAFVSAVCRHPVLSRCSVWHHFMTCTDEKRWKIGKRKEEKDKFLGANYFYTLDTPDVPLDLADIEQESDNCTRFMHNMDSAVKQLMATAADQTKKHQGPYKREYQKIGQAFVQLSAAFKDAPLGGAQDKLTVAIRRTGETYDQIGNMFEDQPKMDWEPLGDMLHIYKGVIGSFPDILAAHRGTLHKRKEQERLAAESKVDEAQLQEVKRRTDVVSYAVLAEVNHFHAERSVDFNLAMKSYLAEQVKFYQKVVDQLQVALAKYD